jgi:16S rRNA (adenine1518-N6/adenine1519-N6)-dimethyltransferase
VCKKETEFMSADALGPPPPYDLTNPREVRSVERMYHLHARKSFSQHWLVDRDALEAIIAAAAPTKTTNVLEVGAGLGVLTAELARRAGRVVAVEIERDVMPALRDMIAPYTNVEIANADLLDIDPAQFFSATPYTFVGNLPYAITAAALRHFLELAQRPERLVILIQKEAGDMSLLGLSVQFYATPRIVARVPAASFMPPPQVDSAVVALEVHPQPVADALRDRLFAIARAAFAQRRKQLHNVLPGALHLSATQVQEWLTGVGIAPDRRPQTLSVAEWIQLAESDPHQEAQSS